MGSDILFRHGAYRPNTVAGRELLAHELTHVVQQRWAASNLIQRKAETDRLNDGQGEEADRIAAQLKAYSSLFDVRLTQLC